MKGKIINMEWDFRANTGNLTLRGSGAMEDWGEWKERPWEAFREEIRSVTIDSGITAVGDGAFRDCTALEEVELADTWNGWAYLHSAGVRCCRRSHCPEGCG